MQDIISLTLSELRDVISGAVEQGVRNYINSMHPEKDRIKQKEALRWMEAHGLPKALLKKWVDARVVHRYKAGEGRNCMVWYSFNEIQSAVMALRCKQSTGQNDTKCILK